MRFWANLIGYQVVWFCAVIGAGRGQPWLGAMAALLFVVATWWGSHERRADLRLVAVSIALGIVLDGGLAASGLLRYASATPSLFAPVWILTIWAAFAMTLNHSLAFLRGRAWWAALLGAIGGPLAYLGAARGFAAVEFAAPAWRGLAALALGWLLAMPLLAVLTQRWSRADTIPVIPEEPVR